jgi:hypothetical protein
VNIKQLPDQKSNGQLTRALFEAGDVAVSTAGSTAPASAPFGQNIRSKSFFEGAIATEWRKQVPSIIQTGKLLNQAKDELDSNDFAALKIPVSVRVSQMLRQIANNLVLSDPANFSSLCPCWRTLALLARLPDQKLKAMIADGRIHPKLKQKEARALCGLSPVGARKGNGRDHKDGNQDEPPPDSITIWGTFSPADKKAVLENEGRAGLVKIAPDLAVDLAEHAIRQEMVGASTKLKPAALLTAILRATLDPANDSVAVFARFKAKLKSFGLDLHDISVAVRGKQKKKR